MRTTLAVGLVLAALGAIVALAPWAATADQGPAGGVRSGIYSPTPTPTPTAVLLPDLVPQSMQITLETGGDCDYTSTQLGVRVFFGNVGGADAGSFVVEVNGAQQTVAVGLAQGGSDSLWFSGYVFGPEENVAVVDATFQVEESNEDNNTLAQIVPIPTLPQPCTPTPTATPTPTPTPTHLGDVNKDGMIDSRDALLLIQFIAAIISPGTDTGNGDVNEDGLANGLDAILILQFHAGLIASLPP